MLLTQTLDKLDALGLFGMVLGLREQLESNQYLNLSFDERLGLLVDREAETRDSRRLALTHEGLARLMAVRRSGITVALHTLEGRRLIRARRNLVEILDYEGLADTAGETPLNRTLGS